MANKYEYQSDFAKKYYGQGIEEGAAIGKAEGKAEALLLILQARGVDVPDAARNRVASETDGGVLDVWLARAARASSVDEVLGS